MFPRNGGARLLSRVALLGVALGIWQALSSTGVLDSSEFPSMASTMRALGKELAELLYHDQDLRALAVGQMERIEQDPERFERFLRNRIATAHLGWNPYLHDPKLPQRLHRIQAPTLLLWGARDRLLPLDYAHRWLELLPRAELSIVEDAGHLPLVERPDAALGALRTFLDGRGAP